MFGSSAVRVSKTVPIAYARTQMGESKIRAQNNPGTVTWVLAKLEMPIVIVGRTDVYGGVANTQPNYDCAKTLFDSYITVRSRSDRLNANAVTDDRVTGKWFFLLPY